LPLLIKVNSCDFVDCIYPIELDIKDFTYTAKPASYLDLHLEIDNEGRFRAKLDHKRDIIFSHSCAKLSNLS
jgi:hypothetical protein